MTRMLSEGFPEGSLDRPVPWSTEPLALGEGARWINGELLLVDIPTGRLLRAKGDVAGPLSLITQVSHTLGAIAPVAGRDDMWVAAVGDGVALLTSQGALHWIAHLEEGARVPTRMNDGVADAAGRFWAGSMATDGQGNQGSLYRLDPNGRVSMMLTGLGISNGPAFSPDGKIMYVSDTARREIYKWELDPITGDPTCDDGCPTVFVTLDAPADPDGMAVDREGGVWVAAWGAASVHRYLPDGRLERTIELPARHPASVCLGGPGGTRLFIATATLDLDSPSRWDGLLYAVDVEVPGPAASSFVWTPDAAPTGPGEHAREGHSVYDLKAVRPETGITGDNTSNQEGEVSGPS